MAALTGTQQKQLIEYVQGHHPWMGETQIRKMLNQAQKEICEESGFLKAWFTDTTVANQRFYDLDSDIIKVLKVELTDANGNYYMIPRVVGRVDSGDGT